jgi:hypothetical protein
MTEANEVSELRADIRHWRRDRANARLVDVLSDLYVVLFALVMLGAMAANAVISIGKVSTRLCTTNACQDARSMFPWLVGLAAVLMVLSMARLFGPVFVSPAVSTWMLPAPIDRLALFRPRLLSFVFITSLGTAVASLAAATMGGFDPTVVIAFGASSVILAVIVVSVASFSQARGGLVASVLALLFGGTVWIGLVLVALSEVPVTGPPTLASGWVIGVCIAMPITALLLVQATRDLRRLRRADVARGGALAPGLSGALYGLDLALLYDLLLAHRWKRRGFVRARRGGPRGATALVGYDLVRLARSPEMLLILLGSVVIPYAVQAAGAGRVVVLVASLTGFLGGLRFLAALRVVCRTPSLVRLMPFAGAMTRAATLVVPGVCLLVFGLASSPALKEAVDGSSLEALLLGVAVGASALASGTRWITGRPPDYSGPLVSTPAGGVPTNLYGSALRGFDVLLLTSTPMLISPSLNGTALSVGLSATVLAFLTLRR